MELLILMVPLSKSLMWGAFVAIINVRSQDFVLNFIYYREESLKDNVFRCHLSISVLYLNNDELAKALETAELAYKLVKEEGNKADALEALLQIGLVSFLTILIARKVGDNLYNNDNEYHYSYF